MTTALRSVVLALAATSMAVPGLSAAAPPEASEHVPGEVLVKFAPRVTAEAARAAAVASGDADVRALGPDGVRRVKLGPGRSVAEAVAAYGARPDVEYAQPNYVYRATALPDDPQVGQLWGFLNTGQTIATGSYGTNNPGLAGADARVSLAWNALTDCSAVVVAVVDSGVNYGHEDLAANMWDGGTAAPHHGWDFADGDNDPMDGNGHGTHVAGTIGAAGNNGRGVAGVCWKASLMAVRVLDAAGSGTTVTVAQGIDFATAHGAKVINMSLGGGGAFDQAFSDAIGRAKDAGVAVIVAAGNSNRNVDAGTAAYPCSFTHPNLLCVAALDQADQRATFSNVGGVSVDVGAPGTNIRSAYDAETTISDSLSSGWTFSSTTGGGWGYGTTTNNDRILADIGYANNTDDRAFKTIDLTGAGFTELEFAALGRDAAGDTFSARCAPTTSGAAADPFARTGTTLVQEDGGALVGFFHFLASDVTGCAGGFASFGFRLVSNATSTANQAVGVGFFTLTIHTPSAATYGTLSGTSMATPLTAGVAALLRARNPLYTATDVIEAIEAAGRPVAALAGFTKTGKAVDAAATLAYLRPPTGLTATVH